MAKPGRKPILDKVKRREICALVTAGTGLEKAASYVGCSLRTIQREVCRNDEFREALRHAEMAQEITPLQAMRRAAGSDWRAAAWMLERSFPDRFGRSNSRGLGKAELRQLTDEVLRVIHDDVSDRMLRDRIKARITATIDYMSQTLCNPERSAAGLREVLSHFDAMEREDPLHDLIYPERAKAKSATSDWGHNPDEFVTPQGAQRTDYEEFCHPRSEEDPEKQAPGGYAA